MNTTFTSFNFETPIVTFDVYKNADSDVYRAVVSAPIDFEVHFHFSKGNFVQVSNNPDFYDSLIAGVKSAVVKKQHLLAESFESSNADRFETIRFANKQPVPLSPLRLVARNLVSRFRLRLNLH